MKTTLFLRSIQLIVPGVSCTLVNIKGFNVPTDVNKVTQLAHFLRKTLCLGACALSQLIKQVHTCLRCGWFCGPLCVPDNNLYDNDMCM